MCVLLHRCFFPHCVNLSNWIPIFAPVESNLEPKKTASAKRQPGEKQCTGEETIRPQRRSGAWRKKLKEVQKALCAVCASESCKDSEDEISAMWGTLPGLCDFRKLATFINFRFFCRCVFFYFVAFRNASDEHLSESQMDNCP